MQLQGCMMQSLWLLWAQHGPGTRSTTSLSTWPTTKDLAESGFGRAVRSVYDQQCVKPSNVSAALSLITLARLGAVLGAARTAAPFPFPLCRKGRRHPPEKAPSLPAFIPALLVMSLQVELQSGPICFDLVTSIFMRGMLRQ